MNAGCLSHAGGRPPLLVVNVSLQTHKHKGVFGVSGRTSAPSTEVAWLADWLLGQAKGPLVGRTGVRCLSNRWENIWVKDVSRYGIEITVSRARRPAGGLYGSREARTGVGSTGRVNNGQPFALHP